MVINNYSNNYTLSSYNMQQKVGIMHSIRIKTSYTTFRPPHASENIIKFKTNLVYDERKIQNNPNSIFDFG